MFRQQSSAGGRQPAPLAWYRGWHLAIGAAEAALVTLGVALLPAVVRELGPMPTAFLAAVVTCSILMQLAELRRLRHP